MNPDKQKDKHKKKIKPSKPVKGKKKVKIERGDDMQKFADDRDPLDDSASEHIEPDLAGDGKDEEPEIMTDEQRISKLETEIAKVRDDLMRERASFINYRKRTEEEKLQIRRYGAQDMAFDLLTVLDYFEESLKFESADQDAHAVIQGVKFTVEEMHKLLSKHGIREIDTSIAFDPKLHEAFCRDETSEYKSGTILKTHRKGYTYKDRVLRPSMVTVASAPESTEDKNDEGNGRTENDENES